MENRYLVVDRNIHHKISCARAYSNYKGSKNHKAADREPKWVPLEKHRGMALVLYQLREAACKPPRPIKPGLNHPPAA